MKKLIVSLIILSTVLTAYAKDKPLELLFDPFPPFHFTKPDGSFDGLAIEVMQQVLKQMKVSYKIEEKPYARVHLMMKNGHTDGSFASSLQEDRSQYSYYPQEPLFNSKWGLFIRKENQQRMQFKSYQDLIGHRIGTVRNYAYSKELWALLNENNIEPEVVTTDEQNFKKLAVGRIDYIPAEMMNGYYLIKKLGLEDKIIAVPDFVLFETPLYALWSNKTTDRIFVKQFSQALKQFKSSEKYKRIIKKYSGNI